MSKHTPGPWVWDEDGAALRTIGEQSVCILQDGEGLWNLWLNPCLNRGVGAANARLIAAAPELLEALDQCLNGTLIGGHTHNDNGLEVLAERCGSPHVAAELRRLAGIARAAIAAVEGEKA